MNCFNIIAMRLAHRNRSAAATQEVLTRFGCNIRMRLGLHDVSEDFCATDGLVLLQVCGEKDELAALLNALNDLDGVRAKLIDLDD